MNVVFYCQHVLGIGHFFRSLELARAFRRHRLLLVTGGPRVDVALPEHVTEYRLPPLEMDPEFTALFPGERGQSLEEVQEERRNLLLSLFATSLVDLVVVELYPFGRRRFGFELLPVLEAIRRGDLGAARVVCSLRDILVEKKDRETYEGRVLDLLNRYFHALLVHADPSVVSLDETFRRRAEIEIPLAYTGFVTPRPPEGGGGGGGGGGAPRPFSRRYWTPMVSWPEGGTLPSICSPGPTWSSGKPPPWRHGGNLSRECRWRGSPENSSPSSPPPISPSAWRATTPA
jgi:hypothetical protein